MATRTEKINDVLRSIRTSSPEVIGACVVNTEGFIVAANIPQEIDEDLVGGMAASLLGVGERIALDMMNATMQQTYIRSDKGYIIINSLDADNAVVLLVTKDAKLGMVFLELKKLVKEIQRHL